MYSQISAWYRASGIRRFHTLPMLFPDAVGVHTGGVMYIVNFLMKGLFSDTNRLSMLLAAMQHDLAEFKTGDIPSPTKNALGGDRVRAMEENYLLSMDAHSLFEVEGDESEGLRGILTFADAADGLIRAAAECRLRNTDFEEAYENYRLYCVERKRAMVSGLISNELGRRAQYIIEYAEDIKKGGAL